MRRLTTRYNKRVELPALAESAATYAALMLRMLEAAKLDRADRLGAMNEARFSVAVHHTDNFFIKIGKISDFGQRKRISQFTPALVDDVYLARARAFRSVCNAARATLRAILMLRVAISEAEAMRLLERAYDVYVTADTVLHAIDNGIEWRGSTYAARLMDSANFDAMCNGLV